MYLNRALTSITTLDLKKIENVSDSNLHMTLNLCIDEFIKNKSKKHTRQKKLNIV